MMIDIDDMRRRFAKGGRLSPDVDALCDEVERLRAEKLEKATTHIGSMYRLKLRANAVVLAVREHLKWKAVPCAHPSAADCTSLCRLIDALCAYEVEEARQRETLKRQVEAL